MISSSNGFIFLIQKCRASAELQEGHLPFQGRALLGKTQNSPFLPFSSSLSFPAFPPSHSITSPSNLEQLGDSHNDISPPCSPWTLHLAPQPLIKAICPRAVWDK